ncbi:MAG: cupin [Planctomycetota bacterium]|nr:MAG: cupin [Planctomycetota bacterium]
MPKLINRPTITTVGENPPMQVREFTGTRNTGESGLSVASMNAPMGWTGVGQKPDFNETLVVFTGMLRVESRGRRDEVQAGQAIQCAAGEWVRYSAPNAGGATYMSVCEPSFTEAGAHRGP